jgi:hypothetical protein
MKRIWMVLKSFFSFAPKRYGHDNYPLARKEEIKSGKWKKEVMLDEHEYASYHLN